MQTFIDIVWIKWEWINETTNDEEVHMKIELNGSEWKAVVSQSITYNTCMWKMEMVSSAL